VADSRTENGGAPRRGPLGRVLGESIGGLDQLLRLLPEVVGQLRRISRYTESMATEVRGMHAAVVRLEHEVQGLRQDVVGLDHRMEAVEETVARLEPSIADMNLAVRPLRRARARLPRRLPDTPVPAALAESEPPELEAGGPHGDPLVPRA